MGSVLLDNKVNVAKALRVYQKVVNEGVRDQNQVVWQGLTVGSDWDGYSINLSEGRVNLQIFFHQRFSLEAPNRKEAALFLKKLDRLDRE
tara:strand:+ start:36 stop:305 length:270 start_codon:yes stop_codon:yes gene_type:complete